MRSLLFRTAAVAAFLSTGGFLSAGDNNGGRVSAGGFALGGDHNGVRVMESVRTPSTANSSIKMSGVAGIHSPAPSPQAVAVHSAPRAPVSSGGGPIGYSGKGSNSSYVQTYGKSFSGGVYYPGRTHSHWTYSCYSQRYNCNCYYCPYTCCYYYWSEPACCYCPVSCHPCIQTVTPTPCYTCVQPATSTVQVQTQVQTQTQTQTQYQTQYQTQVPSGIQRTTSPVGPPPGVPPVPQ